LALNTTDIPLTNMTINRNSWGPAGSTTVYPGTTMNTQNINATNPPGPFPYATGTTAQAQQWTLEVFDPDGGMPYETLVHRNDRVLSVGRSGFDTVRIPIPSPGDVVRQGGYTVYNITRPPQYMDPTAVVDYRYRGPVDPPGYYGGTSNTPPPLPVPSPAITKRAMMDFLKDQLQIKVALELNGTQLAVSAKLFLNGEKEDLVLSEDEDFIEMADLFGNDL
jgi:hypothetical protein